MSISQKIFDPKGTLTQIDTKTVLVKNSQVTPLKPWKLELLPRNYEQITGAEVCERSAQRPAATLNVFRRNRYEDNITSYLLPPRNQSVARMGIGDFVRATDEHGTSGVTNYYRTF